MCFSSVFLYVAWRVIRGALMTVIGLRQNRTRTLQKIRQTIRVPREVHISKCTIDCQNVATYISPET